jgi:hypothetical protein
MSDVVNAPARPRAYFDDASGVDTLKTYQRHRAEIEATVLRRIAGGSFEPVLLRESHFGVR